MADIPLITPLREINATSATTLGPLQKALNNSKRHKAQQAVAVAAVAPSGTHKSSSSDTHGRTVSVSGGGGRIMEGRGGGLLGLSLFPLTATTG